MDRALPVLAEIDLVHVGVHEIRLREMQLERDGHRRFAQLAADRLIRREEVAADELLRERAATLRDPACPHVRPRPRAGSPSGSTPWCVSKLRSSTAFSAAGSSGGTSAGCRTMRSSP